MYSASDSDVHISIDIEIYDADMIPRIISGEYRALSPQLKIRSFDCSICGANIETCAHQQGLKYGNETCQAIAKGVEVVEVSAVKVPEDARAQITDLLIDDKDGCRYLWYGFATALNGERTRNIGKALGSNLIPLNAALKFLRDFSNRSDGKSEFTKEIIQS